MFFLFKLVLTTISLGGSFSGIPFLLGRYSFIGLKIYDIGDDKLVEVLERCWSLSLTMYMVISISETCSFMVDVLTTELSIRSSMILLNSMSMRTVCNTMLLLEWIFINLFKYLPKCLFVQIGTCLTVTSFIIFYILIKNGVPFTNITSSTIVKNLYNFKNCLGT